MNTAVPLLTATYQANPIRFTVSTDTETKLGTLFVNIVKPDSTADVTCSRIVVTLPVGDQAADLVMPNKATNIDDYVRDSTGGTWNVVRDPPATSVEAPAWGEIPEHPYANMFIPDDADYYQPAHFITAGDTMTLDYGAVQEIHTLNIATGIDERWKIPPVRIESSVDGEHYTAVGPDQGYEMDTDNIFLEFARPISAQFIRITTVNDQPEDRIVMRRFLINVGDPVTRAANDFVSFDCTPEPSPALFDARRQFTLILSSIPINKTPGEATTTVTETTATSGTPEDRTTTLTGIEKASNDFLFDDFSTETPAVDNGQTVKLHWTGSPENSEYYLSWDGEEKKISVPAGMYCTYTTEEPLTHTTTFVLDAQTKNRAGETVHHYRSTTVTVNDPDITSRAITASDELALTDSGIFRAAKGASITAGATVFGSDATLT